MNKLIDKLMYRLFGKPITHKKYPLRADRNIHSVEPERKGSFNGWISEIYNRR